MSFTSSKPRPDQLLSTAQIAAKFCLDCGSDLHWTGWQPGGDYPKRITIKNVGSDVQKFRYKLPATQFFFMEYPELIVLSPGMVATLTVNFRPVLKEEYHDFVEIVSEKGNFFLKVAATLPQLVMEFPHTVDFGSNPVQEVTERTFTIRNTGGVRAQYTWQVPAPFTFSPASGTLDCGKSQVVRASFAPSDASSMNTVATCTVNGGAASYAVMLVSVSGFAFLALSTNSSASAPLSRSLRPMSARSRGSSERTNAAIAFGEVTVGRSVEKTVFLTNSSPVRSSFKVVVHQHDPRDHQATVFRVSPMSGVVQPGAEVKLTVTYQPLCANTISTQDFHIETPGGNTPVLQCTGSAIGMGVKVDVHMVHFEDARLGASQVRELRLINPSNSPARYQIQAVDSESGPCSLSASPLTGTINARVSCIVQVRFKPLAPINYYRRLFICVEHQAPIIVDVLGTAFDDNFRPAPLLPRHVAAYHARNQLGSAYRLASPEQVTQALANDGPALELAPTLRRVLTQIQADDRRIAARAASVAVAPSDLSTSVLARTAAAVLAANGVATSSGAPISSESSEALDAALSPAAAYASFLDDCVSYDTGEQTSAEAFVSPAQLSFGAVAAGSASAPQTITVYNRTAEKMICVWDLPLGSAEAGRPRKHPVLFSVFPPQEDIRPNSSVQFRVQFHSDRDSYYFGRRLECYVYFKRHRSFRLVDDESLVPPLCLHVLASAHTFSEAAMQFLPKASFSLPELAAANSALDLPPTSLGGRSYATINLCNDSDEPLMFSVPSQRELAALRHAAVSSDKSSGAVSPAPSTLLSMMSNSRFRIRPLSGVISRRSHQMFCVEFEPKTAITATESLVERNQKALTTPPQNFSHVFTCLLNNSVQELLQLALHGTGFCPSLLVDRVVYFQPTARGATSSRAITVRNAGRIPVAYRIVVPSADKQNLRVSPSRGVLAPLQQLTLTWEFTPLKSQPYAFRVPILLAVADKLSLLNPRSEAQQAQLQAALKGIAGSNPVDREVQRIWLTLKGEAGDGQIEFEPRNLSFGVVPIQHIDNAPSGSGDLAAPKASGSPQQLNRSSITLRNPSPYTLQYTLHVQQLEPEPLESDSDPSSTSSRPTRSTKHLPSLTSSLSPAKPSSSRASRPLFSFENNSQAGEIIAQGSKRVFINFHPTLPTFYRFQISCRFARLGVSPSTDSFPMPPAPPALGAPILSELQRTRVPSAGGTQALKPRAGSAPVDATPRGSSVVSLARASVNEQPVSPPPPSAGPGHLAPLQGAATAAAAAAAPTDDAEADDAAADMRWPCCIVEGTGCYPLLRIKDARLTSERARNLSRDAVLSMLSVDSINAALLGPLPLAGEQPSAEQPFTSTSLALNRPQELTTGKVRDLLTRLPAFTVHTGAGRLDDAQPSVAYYEIENCGSLPLSWRVRMPGDMDVLLEHWADTGQPTPVAQFQQAISDRNLFVVRPLQGTLQPNTTSVLRVLYHKQFVGRHELPVLLQIVGGQQICLRLVGETLNVLPTAFTMTPEFLRAAASPPGSEEAMAPTQLSILHVHVPLQYRLEPVPLGLHFPRDAELGPAALVEARMSGPCAPEQLFPLRNDSLEELDYQVDCSAFEQHAAAQHGGVAVFACLNPAGRVPPRSTGFLRLVFRPLEAVEYQIKFSLFTVLAEDSRHYYETGRPPQTVVLHARGYFPGQKPMPPQPNLSISCANRPELLELSPFQSMTLPNQFARLSQDALAYGDVPLHSTTTRVLVLCNDTSETMHYRWRNLCVAGEEPDQFETVTISIATELDEDDDDGERTRQLAPGASVLQLVTLKCGGRASLFSRDIQCLVWSAQKEDDFKANLAQQEAQQAASEWGEEEETVLAQHGAFTAAWDRSQKLARPDSRAGQPRSRSVVDSNAESKTADEGSPALTFMGMADSYGEDRVAPMRNGQLAKRDTVVPPPTVSDMLALKGTRLKDPAAWTRYVKQYAADGSLSPEENETLVASMKHLSSDMSTFVRPLSSTPLPNDVRSPSNQGAAVYGRGSARKRARAVVEVQTLHLSVSGTVCSAAELADSFSSSSSPTSSAVSSSNSRPSRDSYFVQTAADLLLQDPATATAPVVTEPAAAQAALASLMQEALQELRQQMSPADLTNEPVPYFENQRPASPPASYVQSAPSFSGAADQITAVASMFDASGQLASHVLAASSATNSADTSDPLIDSLDDETLAVLCSPAFQQLGAYLLNASMQNILAETVHGEFDPGAPPRQVVKGPGLVEENTNERAATDAAKQADEQTQLLKRYAENEASGLQLASWRADQVMNSSYFCQLHGVLAPQALVSTLPAAQESAAALPLKGGAPNTVSSGSLHSKR